MNALSSAKGKKEKVKEIIHKQKLKWQIFSETSKIKNSLPHQVIDTAVHCEYFELKIDQPRKATLID